jgi:periplasmic divalent cation tolerance protein
MAMAPTPLPAHPNTFPDGPQYGLLLTTVGSEAEAKAIAAALVQSQLAACVNLLPIQSIYTWEGQVEQEGEWQLLIKSDLRQFVAISAKVHSLHSYEVPELIALPIVQGSPAYLQWIGEQVPLDRQNE